MNLKTTLQRVLAEFDEKRLYQATHCEDCLKALKAFISQALTESLKEAFAAEKENEKKIISEHNARILNEFQLQGKPDMPLIAYDERVALIPAMKKATEETLKNIEIERENNKF